MIFLYINVRNYIDYGLRYNLNKHFFTSSFLTIITDHDNMNRERSNKDIKNYENRQGSLSELLIRYETSVLAKTKITTTESICIHLKN